MGVIWTVSFVPRLVPHTSSPSRLQDLYPWEAKFDFEYYTTAHIELTQKLLGPVLIDWEVAKLGEESPTSEDNLVFSSEEDCNASMNGEIGDTLFEDIPRYTDGLGLG